MSLGKKRPKTPRAHLRRTVPALDLRRERAARRRARLGRLGLVGLTVVLTALIVHGWGPPFTYRIKQRPTRDIRVNVPSFQVNNLRKTTAARQKAADEVRPIMENDPAPVRELAERLADLCEAVGRTPDLQALPEGLRADWNLDAVTFDELRAATDTPERRDDLKRRIEVAFQPLVRDGVLGPDALPRLESNTVAVEVRPAPAEAERLRAAEAKAATAPAGSLAPPPIPASPATPTTAPPVAPGEPRIVSLDRVLPERMAKSDGAVAREFVGAFSSPAVGQKLFALVAGKLAGSPTLTFDEPATSAARRRAPESVQDVYDTYQRGDLLVEQDQPITDEQLELLRIEHLQSVWHLPLDTRLRRAGAVVVLVGALFALIGYYVQRHEPRLAQSTRQILSLCVLAMATVAVSRILALQQWDAEVIPLALAGMVLAIAYNPHLALMVSFALCLMVNMALGQGIAHFIVLMGGTAMGVLPLSDVRSRTKPIEVGASAALGYFVLTWATGLWQNQPLSLVFTDSLWRAGWGLMAGFFLGGLLPFIESAFGIVTGISLLELGDISHPLLQELVRRAPGTHNHSVAVGTIAEAAAERIGANALLLRVGAYFHDIGKMLKPHYFVENQMGAPSRHSNLAPAMSTLIIIGHVKDGIDLARQHNLPEPIIELIEQHHGTTLVEYFYREAKNRCESNPDLAEVLESSFRYPGPRPQTREAGILMLADAVESASRTLSEPTPARIEGLVGALVDKRLEDGQFDECGLTLREIAEIRDSLIKSLIGIYHGRVKYPEQKTA
jgi:putative nucleotidyltransferase with HDIG domain